MEAMWMMQPPPVAACSPATAWAMRNAPRRFVPSTRSQPATSISRNGTSSATPALLTRTSIRPHRAIAVETVSRTCSGSPTSAGWANARPPRAAIVSSAVSSGSDLRPTSSTSAPSAAKRVAMASPMPWPAPVTMTFFPSKRRALKKSSLGLFHGPRDDATDEVTLEDQIGRNDRQRRDEEAGHQRRVVRREPSLQREHAHRQGLDAVGLEQQEREQELVPRPQEV